jgi:SAM-dependent methyltransferase
MMDAFDQLVGEAEAAPFSGWDFAYLRGRWREDAPPWDYRADVLGRLPDVSRLLDMGTGGGEFLASLGRLPAYTAATESYTPNVPVARRRLGPLGVDLFTLESDSALPFPDQHFDLIINRHESYDPAEVRRILRVGGTFLTQQVGGDDNARLNEVLGAPLPLNHWSAADASRELADAGYVIVRQLEAFPETCFFDIGAVVYYLKVISWQIEDFSVEGYRDALRRLHAQIIAEGGLTTHSHRLLIEARRPD